MKLLFENWRQYLNEQGPPKFKLYCDMDGVLVDFEKGVLEHMNEKLSEAADRQEELSQLIPDKSNPDYKLWKGAKGAAAELGGFDIEITAQHISKEAGFKKTRKWMYSLVSNNKELWENLPWLAEGKKLWAYIKDFNPDILSAPVDDASVEGKKAWCNNNLGSHVGQNFSKDKSQWGNPDSILIDDRQKYRDQFEIPGGKTIAHDPINAGPTIEQLREYGFVKNETTI